MEDHLALCLGHLKEAEAKLSELQSAPFGTSMEVSRIPEALSFVQQAIDTILESRRMVGSLPASKTRKDVRRGTENDGRGHVMQGMRFT
jgi:hypothetical protein